MFNFMKTIKGRTFFLLFVDILLFDVNKKVRPKWQKFNLSVAIILLIYVLAVLVLAFLGKLEEPQSAGITTIHRQPNQQQSSSVPVEGNAAEGPTPNI